MCDTSIKYKIAVDFNGVQQSPFYLVISVIVAMTVKAALQNDELMT